MEWSSPYPVWVYLLLAIGFLFLIVLARRSAISSRLRQWYLFVPRLIVLALLLGVLLNPIERREHRLPAQPAQVPFVVDASRSMALEQPQTRALQVQQIIQNVNERLQQQASFPRVQLFRFGQQLSSASDYAQLRPIDNTTRLAEALEQLPTRFSRELPRGIVVFSDGVVDDAERLEEVAQVYKNLGIPIYAYPIGNSQLRGDVAIDELVVPSRVDIGSKASIRGTIRGSGFEGERVVLRIRAADRPQIPPLATLPILLSESPQPFEMVVEANPEFGELVLESPPLEGEVSERNNRIPFRLATGSRKLKVLYMEGTTQNEYRWVHDALMEDKDIECVSMVADQQYVQRPRLLRVDDMYRGFPTTREELLEYDCVICSDISLGAFTKEQLDWTVELVSDRGGGFMMVGGITSFGAGSWDQTVWDQLIPVDMTGGRIGTGWLYHTFRVNIPEEAISHPIWRIVEDPVQNRKVLGAMPPFLGTNYVTRLKPAATLLGVSATPIPQAGIMPIFACQSYGRGRTFAFAPDTTADWGRFFESQWGEGDNRYFRRFWRNAVRWLSENSMAGNRRLRMETDRVIYRAGQPIQIRAWAFDEQLRETIDYQLVAQVKAPLLDSPSRAASTISLVPRPQGDSYAGEMATLTWMSAMESDMESDATSGIDAILASHELEVIASQNGQEVARATTRVMILPDLHELTRPRAESESLQQLAEATGGKTLRETAELTAVLMEMRASPGDAIISRQPLWDNHWLWAFIVGLLAVEWILRRVSGFG